MCLSCSVAIGEGWARFASCVRNCDDPARLNEAGPAMALAVEDTAIGTARVAEAMEQFPLSEVTQSRFDSVAVHQNAVAVEAEELDHPTVMRRRR